MSPPPVLIEQGVTRYVFDYDTRDLFAFVDRSGPEGMSLMEASALQDMRHRLRDNPAAVPRSFMSMATTEETLQPMLARAARVHAMQATEAIRTVRGLLDLGVFGTDDAVRILNSPLETQE